MMAAWLHQVAGLQVPAPRIERGRRPLWAYVWPAGLVLAELASGELAPQLRGRRLLELGCGLGVVGLAAAKAGARVTLSDREPEALELVHANAARNQLTVETLRLEWAQVPEALVGAFDVILAADVVYDPAQLSPIMGAVQALLAPDGCAWLADPDRAVRAELVASARRAGLEMTLVRTIEEPPEVPTSDDSHRQPVHVYRIAHRDAAP